MPLVAPAARHRHGEVGVEHRRLHEGGGAERLEALEGELDVRLVDDGHGVPLS